jgi:hypothetical protein
VRIVSGRPGFQFPKRDQADYVTLLRLRQRLPRFDFALGAQASLAQPGLLVDPADIDARRSWSILAHDSGIPEFSA